ncbi:phage terminase large subunit, partial [Salmonella enterica]|uniref:phage terminase large subunit n=1 Tax=Salmonella enterica TaxID=28901 RepID=UPI00352775DF
FESNARKTNREEGILRKVIIEKKASGIGLIQSASRVMRTPIEPFIPDTDKVTRVLSAMPQIKAGNVMIPESAPWMSAFISEFSAFTADMSHRHDDIVDTTTMAINCELNLADDPESRMLSLAGIK